jgi:hypothetical protein
VPARACAHQLTRVRIRARRVRIGAVDLDAIELSVG